jgi:hypothetical protein
MQRIHSPIFEFGRSRTERANAAERKSIDAFLRRVTAQRLTLPGDPAARPLAFRAQESFV